VFEKVLLETVLRSREMEARAWDPLRDVMGRDKASLAAAEAEAHMPQTPAGPIRQVYVTLDRWLSTGSHSRPAA
jgi:hypothetical protein